MFFIQGLKVQCFKLNYSVSCNKIHIDSHSEVQKQQITSKLPRKKH